MSQRDSLLAYTNDQDTPKRSAYKDSKMLGAKAKTTRDFSAPSGRRTRGKRSGSRGGGRQRRGNDTLLEWQQVPSNAVFLHHAEDTLQLLRTSYDMAPGFVQQLAVDSTGDTPIVNIRLADGAAIQARHVVMAVGQNVKVVPQWATAALAAPLAARCRQVIHSTELQAALDLVAPTGNQGALASAVLAGGAMARGPMGRLHVSHFCLPQRPKPFSPTLTPSPSPTSLPFFPSSTPDPGSTAPALAFQQLYKDRRVLVVGGGLSAAHICLSAARHGAKAVTLATRNKLRIRPLDVGLEWFDRHSQRRQLCQFLQLPPAERAAHIRASRGGGSITPDVHAQLMALVAHQRLCIAEGVTITALERSAEECYTVQGASDNQARPLGDVDFVVLATGSTTDPAQHPLLSQILATHPIATAGSFPVVSPELRWRHDCPVYIMGAAAGETARRCSARRHPAGRGRTPVMCSPPAGSQYTSAFFSAANRAG